MKKLIAILLLTLSASAMAQHHHGYHGGYYRGPNYGWGWIAPAVIGGAVVYAATRPQVVVQQPSVVVVPQPNQLIVPYPAPQGFHWEQIVDAGCNCNRLVIVQN
jgi:hypothetical protein